MELPSLGLMIVVSDGLQRAVLLQAVLQAMRSVAASALRRTGRVTLSRIAYSIAVIGKSRESEGG